MQRFTVTFDQTGVGASPSQATVGDPDAFVLEMPRGSAAVGVVVPLLGAAFGAFVAVVALVHLSVVGFLIGGPVAGGAGLAARQGLRAASVPLLAAGPGGLYLSGLGLAPGDQRAQVLPWAQLRRLVVCCALEPSAQVGRPAFGQPALAVVTVDPAPGTAAPGAAQLPQVQGMVPYEPGAVDVSSVDPVALAELRKSRPDLSAMLERDRTGSASPRLPYQSLANGLDAAQRAALTEAVHRYAPHVQVVDGPDLDTRGPTVWLGPPAGTH
ncbi:hypothetical protein [Phycicoccus sp. Soil748]|uniref:hypothetical protein n=1 Tax=Phycicoccus sp. Soil748 TaxID=1736397 RepID=UPI00070367A8|nr:hypothetical protein [Phycicoccus sp. Soil748]KRE55440.1 hypothetical protein ASG70_08745 [Phycicoccus sp. Soil748]